mmetsp:Transcript_18178/g.31097  ORF Transcript_18178/g.31097 Transcript_18178/m.31097 type:complete len:106 (+) Transcript_18178:444-761(+)
MEYHNRNYRRVFKPQLQEPMEVGDRLEIYKGGNPVVRGLASQNLKQQPSPSRFDRNQSTQHKTTLGEDFNGTASDLNHNYNGGEMSQMNNSYLRQGNGTFHDDGR